MSNEQKEQLEQAEETLFRLYAENFGTGSSAFRQFRQFLIQGPRAGTGRAMVARIRFDAASVPGKDQGEKQGNNSPVSQQPQQQKQEQPKTSTPKQQDEQQPKQGAADVVEVKTFDALKLKSDIVTLSITAVAQKYGKDELTEYAKSIGADFDGMNEKQLVKSIATKLKDESKG